MQSWMEIGLVEEEWRDVRAGEKDAIKGKKLLPPLWIEHKTARNRRYNHFSRALSQLS